MTRSIHSLAALVVLLVPLTAFATPVLVDDIQWRQVSETTGFTWNQVAGVCDTTTGACAGSIDDTDFTGWTWASVTEIGGLFQSLSGFPFNSPGTYRQTNSAWGPAFFDYFTASYTTSSRSGIYGLSRSVSLASTYAYRPYVFDTERYDYISTSTQGGIDSSSSTVGVWLYRQVIPVSESGTLGLFGLGLLALRVRRRTVAVQ